ncbi:hypothetical protein NPIL_669121 [Nephila pilipes]|uniref:Uncharacterized protein n=1 Tax=Nephila pilipes TaxID=299642 RepID=A0A8X6U106_NEPPI|nr:hypothetical protein NPIL_669121 [Nephila pilipes]
MNPRLHEDVRAQPISMPASKVRETVLPGFAKCSRWWMESGTPGRRRLAESGNGFREEEKEGSVLDLFLLFLFVTLFLSYNQKFLFCHRIKSRIYHVSSFSILHSTQYEMWPIFWAGSQFLFPWRREEIKRK